MKTKLFDQNKEHSTLPISYHYLTEFPLMNTPELLTASIPKEAYNSHGSVLAPFYKPISIDFSDDN